MLTFEADTHTYTVNGREVPSVTQIMSRIAVRTSIDEQWGSLTGMEWMKNNTAAQFGTEFHRFAQITLHGGEPVYDKQMEPWIEGFRAFRKDHLHLETIIHDGRPMIERPMYCKPLDFCGTPDWLVMNGATPIIIDWKTGSITNPIQHVQLGGYAMLTEEHTDIRGWETWIVYIKKGAYAIRKRSKQQVKIDKAKFTSVVNVYKMGA